MQPRTHRIDLNADLGEGGTADEAMLGLISSANIACGGHAGNDETMLRTIRLALARGVGIGAHPGHEDPARFGRHEIPLRPGELADLLRRQTDRLRRCADREGGRIRHIKPHGALYHQCNRDPRLAEEWCATQATFPERPALIGPPQGCLALAAAAAHLEYWPEGFLDRGYLPDGNLIPRNQPGAVLRNPAEAIRQAHQLLSQTHPPLPLCVHGDSPAALAILQACHHTLTTQGWQILPPPS